MKRLLSIILVALFLSQGIVSAKHHKKHHNDKCCNIQKKCNDKSCKKTCSTCKKEKCECRKKEKSSCNKCN